MQGNSLLSPASCFALLRSHWPLFPCVYDTLLVAWEGKREAEIQTSTVHNKAALPRSPLPHSFSLLFRPCTISFPFPSKQREREEGFLRKKKREGQETGLVCLPSAAITSRKPQQSRRKTGKGRKGGGRTSRRVLFRSLLPHCWHCMSPIARRRKRRNEEGGRWQQRECGGRTIRMRARLGLERGQGYRRSTVL